MDLSTIVTLYESVEQQLDKNLKDLPKARQLEEVIYILNAVSEADEQVAEMAWEVWKYVEKYCLWESHYPTLDKFKEAMNYDLTIKTILNRHQMQSQRKQSEARAILYNWKLLPYKALPVDLQPPKFSEKLLWNLNCLSQMCSQELAIQMLRVQVNLRLSKGLGLGGAGQGKALRSRHVLIGDII